MGYREYPHPIKVQFFPGHDGYMEGEALGVREIELAPIIGDGRPRSKFVFMVRLPDGSGALVDQRDILPK